MAAIALPNPASIRLHQAFGFTEAGVLRGVGWKFDAWHDVAYWQLVLGESAPPAGIRPVDEGR